jgi:hypothetical protein
MFDAIGKSRPNNKSREKRQKILENTSGVQLPLFLATDNLKPFISSDLTKEGTIVDFVHTKDGKNIGPKCTGFDATKLPDVCGVFIDDFNDIFTRYKENSKDEEC